MTTPLPTITDFGGEPLIVLRKVVEDDERWTAFNPSIAVSPEGRYCMTIRSSNYFIPDETGVTRLHFGTHIESRIWFCEVDPETLEVSKPHEVQLETSGDVPLHRGVEDARLYWREGGWYFTAVIFEPPTIKYARLGEFKYDEQTGIATLLQLLPAPRWDRSEKNWMPANVATPEFDFIYSTSNTYKGGEVIGNLPDMETSIEKDRYLSSLRGGSQLVLQEDGTYLAVLHDVHVKSRRFSDPKTFGVSITYQRDYRHYFARFSGKGALTHVSEPFLIKKQGIEYVAGLVEHGDDMIISFGARDVMAGLVRVPKSAVVGSLQAIGT